MDGRELIDDEELHELLEVVPNVHSGFQETDNNLNHLQQLFKYTIENEIEKIKIFVQETSEDLQNYRYENYDNNTIIVQACLDDRVTADTLEALYCSLLLKYGKIDSVDDLWYGWEPIHFAASAANPSKLKAIVSNMSNINALTYCSENAFHILLEYEKSVEPFEAILYNGTESRFCSIIGQEKKDIVRCAKILIDHGIDINHANFWNDTPTSLAVRYRFTNVIELLIKVPYVDIDNCCESGWTVREFLKLNNLCLNYLPSSDYYQEDPGKILFSYLKAGDENSFIQFNNENIKDYVDIVDGDNDFNTSGTMLQLCFRKGFLEYLQDEAYDNKLTQIDIMDTPMMNVFCSKGLRRCIEHLLDNGADPRVTTRKFKEPLLEAAALRGYYPLVALLLQHKHGRVTSQDIFQLLPKLFDNIFVNNLMNYEVYRHHVLYLLLNKLVEKHYHNFLSSKTRSHLDKILCQLNLENDDTKIDDSDLICQILALGASLCTKGKSKNKKENKTVIERIHYDMLNSHLDDSIDNNSFYYNSLIQDDNSGYSETKVIRFLAGDNVKWELFTHPLLVNLVHNKWLRIYWFFTSVLAFYGFFVLSICLYTLSVHLGYNSQILEIFFATFLGFQLVKELIQLFLLYRFKYFKSGSNYPEMIVIISCIIFLIWPNIYCSVISILCSTIIFFALLGQLPKFTKYTLILNSIKYFLQYACFYFFVFVSFAICFYLVFPYPETDREHFIGDLFKSLFDTLVLFTGEFNERVLHPNLYPVFGRVVITVFTFCMTIILNNLLVGLIVADMDQIQKGLRLFKQEKMVGFIIRTNAFVKRIQKLKNMNCVKSIINYINLFKKGTVKKLDMCDTRPHTFDIQNKEYLKNLRNKKSEAFDRKLLKKVYEKIKQSNEEKMRKIVNRPKNDLSI